MLELSISCADMTRSRWKGVWSRTNDKTLSPDESSRSDATSVEFDPERSGSKETELRTESKVINVVQHSPFVHEN